MVNSEPSDAKRLFLTHINRIHTIVLKIDIIARVMASYVIFATYWYEMKAIRQHLTKMENNTQPNNHKLRIQADYAMHD